MEGASPSPQSRNVHSQTMGVPQRYEALLRRDFCPVTQVRYLPLRNKQRSSTNWLMPWGSILPRLSRFQGTRNEAKRPCYSARLRRLSAVA